MNFGPLLLDLAPYFRMLWRRHWSVSQSVSFYLSSEYIYTIKIALIIYHNTINSAVEKTNITITRRETAK